MSTLQNPWPQISSETSEKHEKCRNIAEEIYKRIDITFQIKKSETDAQSDLSERMTTVKSCIQSTNENGKRKRHSAKKIPKTNAQRQRIFRQNQKMIRNSETLDSNLASDIDSNELSNETDLFACDKSSISSSTELEKLEQGSAACEKYINNNNNEEKKRVVSKRPKKRFRKRVKKQQYKHDSDGSSDEALPLSRVAVDYRDRAPPSPCHAVMGVPNVVITPIDLKKFKLPSPEKKVPRKVEPKEAINNPSIDNEKNIDAVDKEKDLEWRCSLCSLSFRGERGLRRHMTMSHILTDAKK